MSLMESVNEEQFLNITSLSLLPLPVTNTSTDIVPLGIIYSSII